MPYGRGKMVNKYSLFPFLWQAKFADGHSVRQDPQDRYSKFDPKATYNPSSFRDFLDYSEANPDTPLMEFRLENERGRLLPAPFLSFIHASQ